MASFLGFDILLPYSGERYRSDLTAHPFVCHIIMLREPGFLPGNDNWIKVQCNHDLGTPLTHSASLSSHMKYIHKNPTTWSLYYVTYLQNAGILWLPSSKIQASDKGTQGREIPIGSWSAAGSGWPSWHYTVLQERHTVHGTSNKRMFQGPMLKSAHQIYSC